MITFFMLIVFYMSFAYKITHFFAKAVFFSLKIANKTEKTHFL